MATGPDRHGALRYGADVTSEGSNQLSNPPGVFVHGDTTVPRQTRSGTPTTAPPANSHVLKFVSRAKQLQLRGQRNYDRYMRVIKHYVAIDSPKHVQWQRESAHESERDSEWNSRHGPIPGGGSVLPWRHAGEPQARLSTSADTNIR